MLSFCTINTLSVILDVSLIATYIYQNYPKELSYIKFISLLQGFDLFFNPSPLRIMIIAIMCLFVDSDGLHRHNNRLIQRLVCLSLVRYVIMMIYVIITKLIYMLSFCPCSRNKKMNINFVCIHTIIIIKLSYLQRTSL